MNKPVLKFTLLFITFIFLSEILKSSVDLNELLYNSLTEKLTSNQIENYFEIQDRWKWLSYIFIPLYLLIKISVIASVLYMGLFFSNKEISFKNLFNVVVKAEFIFLIVPLFKIVWFYFFQTSYALEDVQYFYPFSALNIIGYENLEPWYIYPLQTLNLFELGYWLYLGYLIGKETETDMDKGFKIVASSYGPALLLWVVTIMFFTLNYS